MVQTGGLIRNDAADNKRISSMDGLKWFISALLFWYFMSPLLMSVLKRSRYAVGAAFAGCAILRIALELAGSNADGIISVDFHVSPLIRCMEFFMGMLSLKIFALFAAIQMEFYLFHQVVIRVLGPEMTVVSHSVFIQSVILFFITVAVSVLYDRLLEEKCTAAAERFLKCI